MFLSPLLLLLSVDWIITITINYTRNGIQWALKDHYESLDFTDAIAFLSHTRNKMQNK